MVFSRSNKMRITLRKKALEDAAIPKNDDPKKRFWWRLNNDFDQILKLNI